ncbi:MAG TPA: PD-(D/E)XK nuclease family transposase, partial [Leptospiraceae bacterium]|nr:PD-(D/E)XK nuclease family transposase [Leptospiraceae bacterium]
NPEICLTEDLEIHIVELPKLEKLLPELQSNLEDWVFLLKEAENLKESDMKTLERKNPKVKKAISELKILSHDKKARILYEERLKADLDYNSGIQHAFSKGKEEGREEGREEGELNSFYLSIEMALEAKFSSKGLALLPEIRTIKDISVLQNILKAVLKAKDLKEISSVIKKAR